MNKREACGARMESLYRAEGKLRLEFLDELVEFDRGSWYAAFAYSSTYAFLTEKLGMSNGTAFRRIRAARLMRRLPLVREYLQAGRISLTKLAMLDDVLEEGNCVELIEKGIQRTEQGVRIMVAELRPESTSTLGVSLTPLTSELTEVNMIVGREWIDTLEWASHVVSHEAQGIPDVLLVCMKKVIAAHQRRTVGVAKPRIRKQVAATRRPTAAVRRAVWQRDQGRCTFTAPDGTRCNSQHQLQEHHIVPAGKQGLATVENITLHCRAHNLERAREDYGAEHMAQFTGSKSDDA